MGQSSSAVSLAWGPPGAAPPPRPPSGTRPAAHLVTSSHMCLSPAGSAARLGTCPSPEATVLTPTGGRAPGQGCHWKGAWSASPGPAACARGFAEPRGLLPEGLLSGGSTGVSEKKGDLGGRQPPRGQDLSRQKLKLGEAGAAGAGAWGQEGEAPSPQRTCTGRAPGGDLCRQWALEAARTGNTQVPRQRHPGSSFLA